MITAKEAREKSDNNSRISIKNVSNELQLKINKATENGLFNISDYTSLNIKQAQELQDEFIKAGYVCTVESLRHYSIYTDWQSKFNISW